MRKLVSLLLVDAKRLPLSRDSTVGLTAPDRLGVQPVLIQQADRLHDDDHLLLKGAVSS